MVTACGKLRYNKQNADLAKLEIQSTMKRFLRFYSFLIQVIRYQNINLHKNIIFYLNLIKEIEIGNIRNDFDIATKLALQVKDLLLKDSRLTE